MSRVTIIKFIMTVENFVCIYRNYFMSNRRVRQFILIRAIVESLVHVTILASNMYFAIKGFYSDPEYLLIVIVLDIMNYVNQVFSIYLAIRLSSKFKELYKSLHLIHTQFENTDTYAKRLKMIKLSTFISLTLFVLIRISTSIVIVYNKIGYYVFVHASLLIRVRFCLLKVFLLYLEFRYMIEHYVFCILTCIISGQVKCLSNEICVRQNNLAKASSIESDAGSNFIYVTKIKLWAGIYMRLAECSGHLTRCFSNQILYSLIATTTQYIFLIYIVVYSFMTHKEFNVFDIKSSSYFMVFNTVLTLCILLVSQSLHNDYGVLKVSLMKLINTMPIGPGSEQLRLAKDLGRVMTTNPIRISFLSTTLVGMQHVPMILSISITYVIVMLQTNHLV